jgi:dihydrofolate reductase
MELVVAASENDVIGRGHALPWRLPADLMRFKSLTLGHSVLMGRKTFESIGHALPGRRNLVLTRTPGFAAPGCTAVASLEEAIAAARGVDAAPGVDARGVDARGVEAPLMVIGGAEVYRQCLPLASRIHLTIVHTQIADGDTWFGDWRGGGWLETARERREPDDRNAFALSFVTLERAPCDAARPDPDM